MDVDYVLECDRGQVMDIAVSAYNGSERLDVPSNSFSGDIHRVLCGARRIVWDPAMAGDTNEGFIPDFRVELTPSPVPLYMIVDLTRSAGEAGQTEYVYESDLTNGVWGAWVRNPVTNLTTVIESVIWTGVTTNDVYKTDKLVLRRIPKGTFEMGTSVPPTISTTLTKDFYAGVFQVTQRQWEHIMETNPSFFDNSDDHMIQPVERVSYTDIRGATNSVPVIDWPRTGPLVFPSSFLGILRAKTAFMDFDLPTEAQWEYACRAGTTTYYNDGIDGSSTNQLNELGWWIGNSGSTTHPVGLKAPNAWGLYDMHGNLREWCVDWYVDPLVVGGVDPKGPVSGTQRAMRSGYYDELANVNRPASRWRDPEAAKWCTLGFRLVRTLP